MQHQIIKTSDGSHTLFVPELNEYYHSINGAVRESNHVFIEAGFKHYLRKRIYQKLGYKNQSDQMIHDKIEKKEILQFSQPYNQKYRHQEINILEIGFGAGLNAFLTLVESEKWPVKMFYNSIELYPITIEEAQKLNYSELVEQSETDAVKTSNPNSSHFLYLHSAPWEKAIEITPAFSLMKQKFDFSKPEKFISDRLFNLIYFDAFAPEKQPDMWTQAIFNKIYSLSDKDAVFTTYCAKGVVRRMLQASGFKMERLPGPPGKREILRGSVV